MPLSPSQILSANQAVFGGSGSSLSAVRARYAQAKQDELARILEQEDQHKDSSGILGKIGGAIGGAIRPVARGLDSARAAVVAGGLELGDLIADVSGVGPQNEASLSDLRENFNRRIGTGDVLEELDATANLPLNVKRLIGGVGDLALDPLNYVTLGSSAAAKSGLGRVAASQGDDVARVLAHEGVDAADNLIASRLAAEQAQEAAVRGVLPRTPQEALAARVAAPAPTTVRDVLGQGVSSRGLERTLRGIERTGTGGLKLNLGRLGAPTLIDSATPVLGKAIDATGAAGRGLAAGLRSSELGQSVRKGLIPLTETRDAFGRQIADALPGIVHRRAALVDAAKADLDRTLAPLIKAAEPAQLDAIRSALDIGGTVEGGLAALDGAEDAQKLLLALDEARNAAYDTLINAGKNPDELLPRDEYLRHVLTDEGAEALGVVRTSRTPGTRTGTFQKRTREGSIDTKLAEDGIASYIDDPVRLTRSSFQYAQDVGGNAMAADALEDVAKSIRGFDVKSVVRHKPATGFTKVAPDRWVADQIYNDAFNLAKSGTQSEIVRAWDTFTGLIKRQTLFNPVAFGPYFTQNMATGVAINAVDGVRASDYAIVRGWHRASAKALEEAGEKGYDAALARLVPDAAEREVIKGLRAEGIFASGHSFYDDFSEDVFDITGRRSLPRRIAEFGTNKTAKVNQYGEEMLRGAAYKRHLENGFTSDAAADLVRKRHLDYSAVGRTRLERDKITRFIFFPTWLMRAPSAIVRAYAHTPGLANVQAKLELGKNWSDRPRNEYGEVIGPRLSGPLSFLSGLGFEATGEPIEQVNPLLRAIFDKDARDIPEIIPPASVVLDKDSSPGGRVGGILSSDEKRSRYLRSLGGVRTGVDYGATRGKEMFEQSLAERAAKREDNPDLPATTPKIRLVEEAVQAGVEGAYSMNSGELARALLDKGYTKAEISRVIEDKNRPLLGV